jgi:hypothetical protein
VLGDGQVNVEFDNAVSGAVTPVTEELSSTNDAPTAAQAHDCRGTRTGLPFRDLLDAN